MRAACSAFTADRVDVYEFLERMDALRLPRLVFGAAKWRRMFGDSDALNTTRTTPTGRARVSAACAFGRAAAEAAPNASTSATRPRVAMRAAPLLTRLLWALRLLARDLVVGAVAWTAPIGISGFVTRLGRRARGRRRRSAKVPSGPAGAGRAVGGPGTFLPGTPLTDSVE